MDDQEKSESNIGVMLLTGHSIGAMLAFMYFSWQYAKENGFLAWLFFGEIVPVLKSLVWEIYLLIAIFK